MKCIDNIFQYSWWSGSLWHYSLNPTINHFYFFAHFLHFSKHSTREGNSNYCNNLLLTSITIAAMIHSTQFQQYFYSRKRRKYWKKIIIKLQNTIMFYLTSSQPVWQDGSIILKYLATMKTCPKAKHFLPKWDQNSILPNTK